jgi:PhnB protein
MFIPDGYGTVVPYIMVSDARKFLAFLEAVFDASELGRTELPDGRIANLRVRIGTSNFMTAEPEAGMLKPMPCAHYIYVQDVDGTLRKAIDCGATKLFDAADMPYGDRQAGIADPFGNYWWISRRLVNEDYAD